MAQAVVGALRVTLGLDSAEFSRGVKKVNSDRKVLESGFGSMAGAARAAGAAIGVATVAAAAGKFLKLADESKVLTAQLRLATAQSGSFAKAQDDVRRIAETTRSGLAETAALYGTFQRNARELGISQDEAARATETITKAFRISGATASEAAGGMRQFLQGIQSGTLRGEELNSVLENAPRLARALADGLGVTIGQLREMGQAGDLTGKQVMAALSGAAESIDREFAQLPVTFEEAMGTVHNAAVVTFGAFDRGGQFSTALAGFVTDGTGGFADLEASAESFGTAVSSEFAGIIAVGNQVIGMVARINSLMGSVPGNAIKWLNDKAAYLSPVTLAMKGITGSATYQQGKTDQSNSLKNAAGEQYIKDRFGGYGVLGTPIEQPAMGRVRGKDTKKKGGGGKSAETLRKEAERELERAADNLRRFTDDLARAQADLASTTADLSGSLEQRAAAEHGQIEADRARRERSIQADKDIDDAKKKQLIALNDQEAAARQAQVNQRLREDMDRQSMQIERDRTNLAVELLGHSRDLARTASERREVELRILDALFEQEKRELEIAANSKDIAEATAARARLAAMPQLRANATQAAHDRTRGPMEDYLSSLPATAEEANEAFERVRAEGINGLIDGLAQAATGARSLGSVFKGVINQIIADLIRIQLQKALVNGLSNVLGGVFGGGGINAMVNPVQGMDALVASNMSKFAGGGSFQVDGFSGVDTNVLSLNGNPVARVSHGEIVNVKHGAANENAAPVVRVVVQANDYFDARVSQVSGQVVAKAAPSIASAGKSAAIQQIQRNNARRLA